MSLPRDLAWENILMSYRSSVAHKFARYALALNYDMLPENVIHQAKRCLLDALGCAVGAYEAPGRVILEDFIDAAGGNEEATMIGSGKKTNALNATLLNSFLVRYLDFNDIGGGAHNSDSISSILAVAEREKKSGKDLLTSIVISYELGARVQEGVGSSAGKLEPMLLKGWTPDFRGSLNVPPAAGRLMGLNEDQIANAMGICGSHSLPLGILDTDKEENTMSKNFRFGFVAHDAVMALDLAKRGFTGPERIVEGENGIGEVILGGNYDADRMTDFSGWRILKCRHKYIPANISTCGHILATLAIVTENDLWPEDIAEVHIRAEKKEAKHCTFFSKKYPRNAESADHSAFYCNAIAIKEHHYGPDSFNEEKYKDPVVLDLIEKITVEADPNIPPKGLAGSSEIITKDGRRFYKMMDVPYGFGEKALTDQELEEKFLSLTTPWMGSEQAEALKNKIWNIDQCEDLGELMKLLVFKK